jgi:hypothetical protein
VIVAVACSHGRLTGARFVHTLRPLPIFHLRNPAERLGFESAVAFHG